VTQTKVIIYILGRRRCSCYFMKSRGTDQQIKHDGKGRKKEKNGANGRRRRENRARVRFWHRMRGKRGANGVNIFSYREGRMNSARLKKREKGQAIMQTIS